MYDICEPIKFARHLLIVACGVSLSLLMTSRAVLGENGVAWVPAQRDLSFERLRKLTVPADSDRVVARGRSGSEALRLMQTILRLYPTKNEVQISYDDDATFGRFCDLDDPFHILIKEDKLTPHDKQCLSWRFPAGVAQPEEFVVGQLQVILIVHRSNKVDSLSFSQITNALKQRESATKEKKSEYAKSALHCFGPLEKTWAWSFLQEKCMTSWQDAEPGVRRLERLKYRDDLLPCANAFEVIANVTKDRKGFGFFAWDEKLTKADLAGVKVLAVATNRGDSPVAPPLAAAIDGNYPLSQPIFLYLHPDAPPQARAFCEFVVSPECVQAAKKVGMWTKTDMEKARGTQRLESVKNGEGVSIAVAGPAANEKLLKELGLQFVTAETPVQIQYQGKPASEAVQQFCEGKAELLVLNTLPNGEFPAKLSKVQSILLGRSALGVVVNAQSKVESLLWDELRKICAGEIKTWPTAKDKENVIHGYSLPPNEPAMQTFGEHLETRKPGRLRLAKQSDSAQVVTAVTKDPGGIGFVDLSQLTSLDNSVILIELVMPDKTVIKARPGYVPENYPLARSVTLYLAETASEPAKNLFSWLVDHPCQKTVASYHLLARQLPERKRELPAPSQPKPILAANQTLPTSDAELGLKEPMETEETAIEEKEPK